MKIVKLEAENIKRLQGVEITPNGSVVKISGRNAQGKSSILDAIWWALGGTGAVQGEPIRQGQHKAHVRLDLGDLIVERRFTEKGTQLVVSNHEGTRFSSPQKMLNELVGRLTFDPLAFMRQDAKKQTETLRDLCCLDFSDLDDARAKAYEERTVANRRVKELTAQISALDVPEDAPDEEVDVADLVAQHQHATALIRQHSEAVQRRDQKIETYHKVAQLIADLEHELSEARAKYASLGEEIEADTDELDACELPDADALVVRMQNAAAINDAVRQRRELDSLKRSLAEYKAEADRMTAAIQAADDEKAERIRSAALPVEGLGFGPDGNVTFHGVPIDQASAAEQLRISVAMAMALNPKLRVLRITDGSLLDSESLATIEEMAAARDYQIWMELVSETGDVGVVIEDGMVKSPEPALQAAE